MAALRRALAVGLSLYALYWAIGIVQPQLYRVAFLLVVLVLTFLAYPLHRDPERRPAPLDLGLAAAAVVALGWPLVDFADFPYRAASPELLDVVLGGVTVLLVLEATRRTTGAVLPWTAVAFVLYAYLGPVLELVGLGLFAHRGYDLTRLMGSLYMTLEGIFGVPLDVAATYIILFSLYGAVLEHSGAGRFFIEWAQAALGRSRGGAGAGRAVTAAGFLLGSVSGSGVATTVTLGSVSWPLLKRSGYPPEVGGAILSAAGIGAILSPPTLGAAAFLIAEFLEIRYLDVLWMAAIPSLLYYLAVLLMIEADSRRLGTAPIDADLPSAWALTRRYGYHFSSLVAIVVFLVIGMSAFRAVLWATALAAALSFLRRETALTPRRLVGALESGARGVLPIAATTATAGIIVGVTTLTGLGLKLAGILVAVAGGSVLATVLLAGLAVWVLGLAVPVTASYIIAAVTVAPALVQVGVPEAGAHMFIFYYAVLSEVSPPTALSAFAAAAITGGNAFRTMMLTWKYTLPAFLVPIAFTVAPAGMALLLEGPPLEVARLGLSAAVGVGALAAGLGGWIVRRATLPERVAATAAGLLLFHPAGRVAAAGAALLAATILAHRAGAARRAGVSPA